jgi:uncharacterized protein (DUF983 family)
MRCELGPESVEPCPQCGGEGAHLGYLGSRLYVRCVRCGWDYSVTPVDEDHGGDGTLPEGE